MRARFRDRVPRMEALELGVPVHVLDRNISTTYITDHYAIANRHAVGVGRDEKHAMLVGNAARVYKLAWIALPRFVSASSAAGNRI